MKNLLVSLSGGMDSTTVLSRALEEPDVEVQAVGFTYGSKHNKYENEAARNVAAHYGLSYDVLDLSNVSQYLESNLLKSGGDIPEGHYESASMSQTVVPGRNIIFASILAGIAWSRDCDEVWLGIHAGDHAIYPDCRPEFFYAMRRAIEFGTDGCVYLEAPFLHSKKQHIIQRGLQLGTPYHLTRTCYKEQPIACGKCGSCQERLEGFKANGIEDPIDYESREILPIS